LTVEGHFGYKRRHNESFPGTNAAVIIDEVKKKLDEIKEDGFPPGMTFELSDEIPAFWRIPRNRVEPEDRYS
jgi:hypothetical protein